jgi:hypothetical protein
MPLNKVPGWYSNPDAVATDTVFGGVNVGWLWVFGGIWGSFNSHPIRTEETPLPLSSRAE